MPLDPHDFQAVAFTAAKKIVKVFRIRQAGRGRGGEGDVASGGGEAFGQAIDVIFAGEAPGEFFGKKVKEFHGVLE